MKDNISKQYKKANKKVVENINKEAKKITKKLDISDRVEELPKKESFPLFKDHKQNFALDPQIRVINPTKSEIGKISKKMLQDINEKIREKTNLQQWNCTGQAIEWFNNIQNKNQMEFIQCDIESFYPSISQSLLEDSIEFARKYTLITELTKSTIMNARQTVLVSDSEVWQKTDSIFDVAMGAFDGAEIAELVGLKILSEIKEKVPEVDFGLYRDDGVAVIKTGSGKKMEDTKKKLIKVFKDNELKISIQTRMHKVDFLDVTLDLHEGVHRPYKKPDNDILYINKCSNHPANVKKVLPGLIQNRLSGLSKNKEIFEESVQDYNNALKKSGYNVKLDYEAKKTSTEEVKKNKQKKKTRKRKVLWYNPPFEQSLDTNIGKEFLKLIDKHFGNKRDDNLHKIINRKTVKIGYSCGPNFGNILKAHNRQVLQKHKEENGQSSNARKCNCRRGETCPLKGDCLSEAVVGETGASPTPGQVRFLLITLEDSIMRLFPVY